MAEAPQDKPQNSEFTTPLATMAIVLHETYSAFLAAGFRDDQAMDLIIRMAEFNITDTEWDDNG